MRGAAGTLYQPQHRAILPICRSTGLSTLTASRIMDASSMPLCIFPSLSCLITWQAEALLRRRAEADPHHGPAEAGRGGGQVSSKMAGILGAAMAGGASVLVGVYAVLKYGAASSLLIIGRGHDITARPSLPHPVVGGVGGHGSGCS